MFGLITDVLRFLGKVINVTVTVYFLTHFTCMNYQSTSDEKLVVALLGDDSHAFREIYQRYCKKMLLMGLSKVDDQDIVEGMVQDVFLKLWERRNLLRIDNLEAYLISAVKYACINHIKSAMVHEKYVSYAHAGLPDAFCSADEQLNVDELMHNIEERLRHFPERAQLIFRLHKLEYKSTKEISFQIKMPQRTVEHHLALVVKALRSYFKDYL
jgi:RNA polymerase sigma factor (sigma-70 family)